MPNAWSLRGMNGRLSECPCCYHRPIGAALAANHWFLHVRCPACRTTRSIDLRQLDWHLDATVTALIPKLSCRSCQPNAAFAELLSNSHRAA
jgi:hypothetical protein